MAAMQNFKITSEKFTEFVLNNDLFIKLELNDRNTNASVQRECRSEYRSEFLVF
jgi:hypothetical protein